MKKTRTAVGLKVRVRADAVGLPPGAADQWVIITAINNDTGELSVTLLGDDSTATVGPASITGVELNQALDIYVTVTRVVGGLGLTLPARTSLTSSTPPSRGGTTHRARAGRPRPGKR